MKIATDLPAAAADRAAGPDWESRLGFSAIYLTYLPREQWAAFQAFARAVLDLEPGFVGSEPALAAPREALAAVLAELRLVQGYLHDQGFFQERSALSLPERSLARLGRRLTRGVDDLVDLLAGAFEGPREPVPVEARP